MFETQLGLSYGWKDVTAHLTTRGKGIDQTSSALPEETPLFSVWQGKKKGDHAVSGSCKALDNSLHGANGAWLGCRRVTGTSTQNLLRGMLKRPCIFGKISNVFTGSGCLPAFCAGQLPSVGIPSRVEPGAVGVVPIKTSPGFPCFFQGGPQTS